MNKISAIILGVVLAGLAAMFCCEPVQAATVLVWPGDTLEWLAHIYMVSPTALARANGLSPYRALEPGMLLTLPGPTGMRALLLPPQVSAHDLVTGTHLSGVKDIDPTLSRESQTSSKSKAWLMPEMRPAVDALTPGSQFAREPKTYDRTAPGLTATIRPGGNTEIQGVFNLPGSSTVSARPYGIPENGNQTSPSGGVMLKRTF